MPEEFKSALARWGASNEHQPRIHGGVVYLEEMELEVASELGKLKGNLKQIWNLIKLQELNRGDIRNLVLEIRKSERYIWNLLRNILQDATQKMSLDQAASFKLLNGKDAQEFIEEAMRQGPFEGTISTLLYQIDNPSIYNDNALKDSVANLVDTIEPTVDQIRAQMGTRYGVPQISELTSSFPEFTSEWTVATCYLSAMEITTNMKLKKLKLQKGKTFHENFSTLLPELKAGGVEVSELEKTLPKLFWDIRNKIVHEGYSPASEELELIVKYVTKFLNTSKRL